MSHAITLVKYAYKNEKEHSLLVPIQNEWSPFALHWNVSYVKSRVNIRFDKNITLLFWSLISFVHTPYTYHSVKNQVS